MSAIAGIVFHDRTVARAEEITAMSAALEHRGRDRTGRWVGEGAAFAHRMLFTTAESLVERQPVMHVESGAVLVADARIDNRAELARALGAVAESLSDSALLLRAWLRWGAECVAHIAGDFAFAVWDARARTLFVARDHMGVRPLYYCRTPQFFAFATEMKALLALPGVDDALDEEQVARHLEWEAAEADRTLYRSIHRLPAAHRLHARGRRVAVERYWTLGDIATLTLRDDREYVEAFREQFSEAVRARLRSALPVGATLSGGLDSSSIVCVGRRELARAGRVPLETFSLVFPSIPDPERRAIDERAYVACVTREGGVVANEVAGDAGSPLADADRTLWHLDEPHFAPNLYLHWSMYRAASERGVGVLLDGFDGDSAVGHGLPRLDELAAARQWDGFEREVRAFAAHREITTRAVLEHYGLPRLDALARSGRWSAWRDAASELARRFEMPARTLLVQHGLRAAVPDSARAVRQRFARAELPLAAAPYGRRLAAERDAARRAQWRDALRDERTAHRAGLDQAAYQHTLETADRCAAAFGIESRYPFFDRRLLELCAAIPAEQKMAGGWTRLVLRRAMEGILPPEIQWRATKANLSPSFRLRFRDADRAAVERIDPASLAPYGDAARFAELRRAVFARDARRVSHADELALFRAALLARFLAARRAPAVERDARSVAPDAGAAAVAGVSAPMHVTTPGAVAREPRRTAPSQWTTATLVSPAKAADRATVVPFPAADVAASPTTPIAGGF